MADFDNDDNNLRHHDAPTFLKIVEERLFTNP